MKYDPFMHHRRSIRLKGFDYTRQGAYFVTLVTLNRECLFDHAIWRRIVENQWLEIPRHCPAVILDAWVVMPNHLHGILVIDDQEHPGILTAGLGSSEECLQAGAAPGTNAARPEGPVPGSLGAVVGTFKSVVTRRINASRKTPGARVWHRNYYEHIGRNDRDLDRIRKYIADNPANWKSDIENPLCHPRSR